MSKWIRKGSRVLVIAGNEKGKTGVVLSRLEDRVLIEGVNLRKKHLRPTQQMQGGRIVEMEMPIHVSNVCICDENDQRVKLRVEKDKNDERVLVYSNGKNYRSIKKTT